MIGESFYYDGRSSSEFGVSIVRLNGGMIRQPFLAEREIIMETIPNNKTPYVYDVVDRPLRFSLFLSCLEGEWTLKKRREVARWLDQSKKFCQFYSQDEPNKWYYIMYEDGIDIHTNGIHQGYIEVHFINISPYSYSPVYYKTFDFSTINNPTVFELENLGDTVLKPLLKIKKIEDGDISIKNNSNQGKEFKFTELLNLEVLTIDNNYRDIESDIGLNRYDNFNGVYLELLPYSINRLEVTGRCMLEFTLQYEIKG